MSSVQMRSAKKGARKAARYAAKRSVVRGGAECGPSSSPLPEKNMKGEEEGRSRSVNGRRELSHEEAGGDRSKRNRCRERDNAVSFAKRAGSSLDSATPAGVHNRVAYSKRKGFGCGNRGHKPFDVARKLVQFVE